MSAPDPVDPNAPSAPLGVRITVAYDGSDFHGFQRQQGLRTVQGALEAAAAQVTREAVVVRGAGRTDAGVHAEGQVAAFATARELNPRRWVQSLNRYLPPDVCVRDAAPCTPDYDPRFDARNKTYRYLFLTSPIRDPLLRNRAWHLDREVRYDAPSRDSLADARARLDLPAMHAAAAALQGTHDYRAFRAAADQRENTTRTLERVVLHEGFRGNPDLLALEVKGTAFMMNMVRILAGTLIGVGSGRLSVDAVRALLGPDGQRRGAGVTAPPEGLTLVHITLGRSRTATPDAASR